MTELSRHPGKWLRDDAAAAFERAEDDHGPFTVTSAGRTVAEQQALIDRWFRGGTFNRPPYLYEPARPPETSGHVRDGGIAVDITNHESFRQIAHRYGFVQPFSWDVVHFEYRPDETGGDGSAGIEENMSKVEAQVERLATVIGGTVERGENGESISQRLDRLSRNFDTLAVEVEVVKANTRWLMDQHGGSNDRDTTLRQDVDQIKNMISDLL